VVAVPVMVMKALIRLGGEKSSGQEPFCSNGKLEKKSPGKLLELKLDLNDIKRKGGDTAQHCTRSTPGLSKGLTGGGILQRLLHFHAEEDTQRWRKIMRFKERGQCGVEGRFRPMAIRKASPSVW